MPTAEARAWPDEPYYPGRCIYCDGRIDEGDEIVLFDGDWIHADHREDDDEVEAACE